MLEDILYGLLTRPFFSKPLTGFSLNPIISHVFTQQATMEGRHSVSLHYCLPTSLWKVDRQLYNRENASLLLGIIKITSHSRANQSILVALSKRFMDQNRWTPLLQHRCHFDFLGFTVRNLQRKSKQWLPLLLMQICPHSGPALLSSVSTHNANCEYRETAQHLHLPSPLPVLESWSSFLVWIWLLTGFASHGLHT